MRTSIPSVSTAFALRSDFPWRRVPGYVVAQLAGAVLAAWFLQAVIHVSSRYGSTYPAPGRTGVDAMLLEAVLTLGLVSIILGTASGAQQVGLFGALGVGSYVALAGLWASPLSGASMNPARTFGPDLVAVHFASYWAYLVGPLIGGVLAVGVAFILRGPGGGRADRRPPRARSSPASYGPTRTDPVMSGGRRAGRSGQPPNIRSRAPDLQVDRPVRSSARSALAASRSPALMPAKRNGSGSQCFDRWPTQASEVISVSRLSTRSRAASARRGWWWTPRRPRTRRPSRARWSGRARPRGTSHGRFPVVRPTGG